MERVLRYKHCTLPMTTASPKTPSLTTQYLLSTSHVSMFSIAFLTSFFLCFLCLAVCGAIIYDTCTTAVQVPPLLGKRYQLFFGAAYARLVQIRRLYLLSHESLESLQRVSRPRLPEMSQLLTSRQAEELYV